MSDTKEVVQDPEKEYEAARHLFHTETYQNQLAAIVNGMAQKKGKGIGRVLRKLVLEPMDGVNGAPVELLGDDERSLYEYCKEIMYAKSVIVRNHINSLSQEEKGETNG